jgi:hypothetical protein
MPDIKTIADKADVIINGYAFTRNEDRIQVLNLNSPDKAAVFSMTVRFLKLLISLRSIIRRCISDGLNTVIKAIMRSNH